MTGYALSRRAALAEARYAGTRGVPLEGKSVTVQGIEAGRQDGDNFRTNKITLERHEDCGGASRHAVGLSATWACVSFWAGNIASLPVTVQRVGPGGVAVDDPTHPLYWLLHDSPNYDQSAFDFWEFVVASIELRGNAYAEIEKRGDGYIVSLTPIPPDIVTVQRNASGELQYRWTDSTGRHARGQGDILHIRGFGGGPLGGISPLAACRQTFNSAVAVDRSASTVFANGIRSTGVFMAEKQMSADQMKVATDLVTEKYVGSMNAGRPMLLNSDMKFQQLSIDPHDAEMLETRRFSVEEICRVFEVDPHLVGQTQGNSTLGSSISEQTLSVLKFKMRKRLKRIEGALSKQLLSRADRAAGVGIRFNIEAFLRGDSAGRAAYYDIMKQFMTKNEIRGLEGLAPVEGGDVLMAQMQDVPLAKAISGSGV
jgi:HK97 family phage portal protein